jgi:hypothetical protein
MLLLPSVVPNLSSVQNDVVYAETFFVKCIQRVCGTRIIDNLLGYGVDVLPVRAKRFHQLQW